MPRAAASAKFGRRALWVRRGGPVRPPDVRVAFVACAALCACAAPAFAWPWPSVGVAVGQTFAINATPDQGGISIGASTLWPLEERFAFGGEISADDFGSVIGQLEDASGNPLGASEELHRAAYGLSWRMDARGPGLWGATTFGSGTWGLYRISDSQVGASLGHVASTGFALGAGLRWPMGAASALGVSVRYRRLFNDVAGRFMSAGVDWTWRGGH
ncbi:MAG: hypothetical protein HYR73_03720 [Candidatus Eisenbacteria bacterium]|nr:hypothetical protein [Candidatus Eisenbacteria bacterium]